MSDYKDYRDRSLSKSDNRDRSSERLDGESATYKAYKNDESKDERRYASGESSENFSKVNSGSRSGSSARSDDRSDSRSRQS